MKATKSTTKQKKLIDKNFTLKKWDKSWTYIKTVIDIVREPILILDMNFRVMFANDPFYKVFRVKQNETKGKIVYNLGNGQWDIPLLRKLLEKILPKHTYFKGFKVDHLFPMIGRKVMLLNARQIHVKDKSNSEERSPIILLAIEDITAMMSVAEAVANRIGNK
jgi:PAS domain-containing protein